MQSGLDGAVQCPCLYLARAQGRESAQHGKMLSECISPDHNASTAASLAHPFDVLHSC